MTITRAMGDTLCSLRGRQCIEALLLLDRLAYLKEKVLTARLASALERVHMWTSCQDKMGCRRLHCLVYSIYAARCGVPSE